MKYKSLTYAITMSLGVLSFSTVLADISVLTGVSDFTYQKPANPEQLIPVGIPAHPAWVTPSSGTWIGPSNGHLTGIVGIYVYTYTFTLSDTNDVSILGQWASDNGTVAFLNGQSIINSPGGQAGTYRSLHSFTVLEPNLFQVGINELRFEVENGGGPTALYVNANIITGSEACQLYAVHDEGLNNTQFFTVSPETFEINALGDMKKAHDIEALDIHPQTAELFAASGKDTHKPGYLYNVDKNTGQLTDIGSTGFKEIDGLSFHPDGTLWGWASGDGLVTIDITTGQANLVAAYPGEVEDLTWNTAGTILFGVANVRNNPDAGVKLLVYDGNTVQTVCEELTQSLEIEALDTLPDDTLLFGLHNRTSLPLGVVDVTNCQIIAEQEIATDYNDVEGIAWPTKACAYQEVAHSCQEIKENTPSSEDGIYQIDSDGKGGNEAFEVYCDMTTGGGGFTFTIGKTVINSFDSIKGGCSKGLSPFQLSSNSHGIALHNYVNQLEGNTRYWANVFAGPHKHVGFPGHRDNEYGYLDSNGEWHNADIDELQSPYHDIPSNWNSNIFDPIPLVGGMGYYADGQMVLYNSTERVIEGYAICSTNDK
ncbi:fibrinogen-like YCDxxxxGGGW domain-containing protein [Candidatus Parabeggiatoa sp. HSG14]|uniref:fibrinogen-like YCDxxxxGGGW domain-containing protein n=1 Tax=Candidatus Parabeggiatoa sp. HSG14 TaxID=3055593 RepID=UPI0025A6B610|nr:fibrinogen-like YCDxxxxGGGW domain-containing protein [Thiotrichales bacterium HSG14]